PLSVSKPRTCAIASSSSRKTMHGATCFAFLKIMRTAFSDSPTHFDMTSGPLIEMKFASDSVATAFASSVFPEPGGPYSKMPRGGRMPIRLNASGSFSGCDRHAAGVDLQDLLPSAPVRDADLDLAIEPTGSAQRRIDCLVPVRRADHDDLAAARKAVHQSEELRDDASLDLTGHLFSFGGDRVELIDEEDARSVLLGLLELLAEALLALTVIFRHDFRALDGIEVRAGFIGHRLRDERLAGAGRTIEENPFRPIDPEALEQFRAFEGELDHLADLHQLLLESADVLVRDRGREDLALASGAHADVSADETVDADDAVAFVLLPDPDELSGGGLLAQTLHALADVPSERDTVLRVDACPTQTAVRLRRFGHLDCNSP